MKNKSKKTVENINSSNEKLLLSDVIHFVCLNGKEPINCPIFDIQKSGCYSCKRYTQTNNV
jgi:hypothetical protein